MMHRIAAPLVAFILALASVPAAAQRQASPEPLPVLQITPEVAAKVGRQVFRNETGGKSDAITSWNAREDFASVGIGHFIWFPAGRKAPFEESFPRLVELMRDRKVRLPAWLDKTPVPHCPWKDRRDFERNRNSPEMTALRRLLLDTFDVQTEFLLARTRAALPKILAATEDGAAREHVRLQFTRVVRASKDLYPLIDYINFKGEGINPDETAFDKQTGKREGWGLRQVLMAMQGTSTAPDAVLAEFAAAARDVLKRRVRNMPENAPWEAGWLKRVETYRRGLS